MKFITILLSTMFLFSGCANYLVGLNSALVNYCDKPIGERMVHLNMLRKMDSEHISVCGETDEEMDEGMYD